MKKTPFFTTFLVFLIGLISFSGSISATDCGGYTNCSCGDNLTSSYTMTYDLNCAGTGLIISADDITLDCDGHYLRGGGRFTGIVAYSKNEFVIENCVIQDFEGSIRLEASNNTVIQNNILHNFFVLNPGSDNNQILRNMFNDRVWVYGENNTFDNNTFTSPSDLGENVMVNVNAFGNNFLNNVFIGQGVISGTRQGMAIMNPNHAVNNTFVNNTISGFVLGIELGGMGFPTLGNEFFYNEITNNTVAVQIANGDLNEIAHNTLDDNLIGFDFIVSHNNVVWGNDFGNDFINFFDIENNLFCFEGRGNTYTFIEEFFNMTNQQRIEYIENLVAEFNQTFPNRELPFEHWIDDYGRIYLIYEIPDCGTIMNNKGQWGGPAKSKSEGWKTFLHSDAIKGEAQYSKPGDGDSFMWQVYTLPTVYDVYVWHFNHEYLDLMATNAPFKIIHAFGEKTIRVDQSKELRYKSIVKGGEWIYLGRYTFDQSTQWQGVELSDRANGYVMADAIKIVSVKPAYTEDVYLE